MKRYGYPSRPYKRLSDSGARRFRKLGIPPDHPASFNRCIRDQLRTNCSNRASSVSHIQQAICFCKCRGCYKATNSDLRYPVESSGKGSQNEILSGAVQGSLDQRSQYRITIFFLCFLLAAEMPGICFVQLIFNENFTYPKKKRKHPIRCPGTLGLGSPFLHLGILYSYVG